MFKALITASSISCWVLKLICDIDSFAWPWLVTRTRPHSRKQSKGKTRVMASWTQSFSRAWRSSRVYLEFSLAPCGLILIGCGYVLVTVDAHALYKLDTQSTIAISRLTVKNNMPPNETFPDDSILPKRERFPLCELQSLNGILEDGKVKGNSVSD